MCTTQLSVPECTALECINQLARFVRLLPRTVHGRTLLTVQSMHGGCLRSALIQLVRASFSLFWRARQVMGQAISTDLSLSWERLSVAGGPGPREGSSLLCVDDDVLLFGGNGEAAQHGDVWRYRQGAWSRIEVAAGEPQPSARAGSAAAVVGKSVFVFGGLDADEAAGGWLADLWCFDTAAGRWLALHGAANGPSPRDKSGAVAVGGNFVLFGGFGPVEEADSSAGEEMVGSDDDNDDDDDGEGDQMGPAKFRWFNDLYVWNVGRSEWRRVPCANAPPVRAAHSLFVMAGRLWVFGGKSTNGRQADLWSCAVADVLGGGSGGKAVQWTEVALKGGVQPAGRSFQAMASVPDVSRAVLFGGVDASDCHLGDVHVFDATIGGWAQPVSNTAAPSARGFAAHCADATHMYLYGGSSRAALATEEGAPLTEILGDFYRLPLDGVRRASMQLPPPPQ